MQVFTASRKLTQRRQSVTSFVQIQPNSLKIPENSLK
jgi:hypothetical protein